jgi:hypothetical protein
MEPKILISDNYKCIAELFGEKRREFDYADAVYLNN